MAIALVGIGTTVLATTTATTQTPAFTPKSRYLRLTATGTDINVAIGTNPQVGQGDLIIPNGTSETLSISNASARVSGITTGNPTLVDLSEGTQSPFGVGDYVTMTVGQAYWTTNLSDVRVSQVYTGSGHGGYHSSRIALEFNSGASGAPASWVAPGGGLLRASLKVGAKAHRSGIGTVHIQQVQVSGDA